MVPIWPLPPERRIIGEETRASDGWKANHRDHGGRREGTESAPPVLRARSQKRDVAPGARGRTISPRLDVCGPLHVVDEDQSAVDTFRLHNSIVLVLREPDRQFPDALITQGASIQKCVGVTDFV